MDVLEKRFSRVLKAIYHFRRAGWVWLPTGAFFIIIAALSPSAEAPLATLGALIGATIAGYLAPKKRAILLLGAIASIAAVASWAGPGDLSGEGIQWLAAALCLIGVSVAVLHYIRLLEEGVWEYQWRAELSCEAADLGLFRWIYDTELVQVNAKHREMMGIPLRGPIFSDAALARIHPDDRANVEAAIETSRRMRSPFRADFRISPKDAPTRWISARGREISDPRTGERSLAGVIFDITDLKEAASHIRKLIDGVGALFAIAAPNGQIIELNKFGVEMARIGSTDIKDLFFWDLPMWGGSTENRSAIRSKFEKAMAGDQAFGETPFWRSDGEKGLALVTATPIVNENGQIHSVSVCAIDITGRKAAEEVNLLLVQELNHRIKNLFSVTNALISLSARHATSIETFASSTRERLAALHAAHNIGAVDLHNRRPDLRAIVETTLKPWSANPPRLSIEGESVQIDAGAATAWALIVHELATNAIKYGALKQPGGKVSVRWTHLDDQLVFEWIEDGAIVQDSDRSPSGFGTTIIRRLSEGYLNGGVEPTFGKNGLIVKISARLAPTNHDYS